MGIVVPEASTRGLIHAVDVDDVLGLREPHREHGH